MDILKLDLNKTGPEGPTEKEARFQVALLAAISAVAAGFLARFGFDAPLVPELLAHFIFAVAPIWTVELVVGMLGPFGKHLAFLACVVAYLFALTGAGALYLEYCDRRRLGATQPVYLACFSLLLALVTALVVIPLLGGGPSGRYLRQGVASTAAALIATYAAYGLALWALSALYLRRPEVARAGNYRLGRRKVMRGVGYAVLAVGAYDIAKSLLQAWWQAGSGRVKGGDGVFPNINGLALEITPTGDFYEVSKNPFDPDVDARRWRLEVGGLVETPLSLGYDEIRSLPAVEQYATLACISNTVGGNLIGNASWRGVRLREVLERAGLKEGVVDIAFRASDDYRDSIPLDRAMADATLLVYEMNGAQLTPAHGFPLRLIVPGIYGMKNVKWITRIEALDYDLKGYWQKRGWDDRAHYKTMSRIDAPDDTVEGAASIAGIAFAGDRGISKVEVSTDGGKSWEQAEVRAPLSAYTWVLWHMAWKPARAGRHALVVRATDGPGVTQTAQYAPPEPSGSSGYHSTRVDSK